MHPENDPFLPGSRPILAQVRGGNVAAAVRSVTGDVALQGDIGPRPGLAGDIANLPEAGRLEQLLARGAVAYLERYSPFRPFVTRVILRSDVTRLGLDRYGSATSGAPKPSQIISGPSGFLTAYALPRDDSPPAAIPADVSWNNNPATATPNELLSQTAISNELLSNAIESTRIEAGRPIIEEPPARPDPWTVWWLGEAIKTQENVEFAAGAATNADPWRGLANIAGLSTFAAGASLGQMDDVLKAIAKLRAARRNPNAAFVSTGLAHVMRTAKTTTNAYLMPFEDPPEGWADWLTIEPGLIVGWVRSVPIIELDSLPNGAGVTSLYVGDFRNIIMTQRVYAGGMLARLAESAHMDFASDKFRYRLAESWDVTLIPNQGSAIYAVTGITAAAP
jgi:hypothetical protein